MKPRKLKRSSSHSIRTADVTWNKAKDRAEREGVTLNSVLEAILEGYANEQLHLPKVTIHKSYANSAPASE